ncbi:MAG TPA: hypothetical protein VGQ35_04075 [Dongiaceae bacterium]|nr:hypothetical protein [Dongiaceae bacterium]
MRRNLATALTILGMPLTAGHALAAEPAPAGATATIEFKVTVREQTKSDFHSTAIERVLNAQCVMQAGQASQVGSKGMTPEQQAAMEASTAKAQDVQQQFAPSDETLANMEAEAEKCGNDEACLTALAMKMSQTPEMQAMAQQVPEAQQAMQGVTPDLGPARYQMWQPQGCTGVVTVNDTYVDSDPGGEGGDGAYTDTTTAKGSAKIMPDWRGLVIETDVVKGTTQYTLGSPPPVVVATDSSRIGAGERQIPFLAGTKLPDSFGPYKGVGGKHKGQVKGEAGSISAEWVWKK